MKLPLVQHEQVDRPFAILTNDNACLLHHSCYIEVVIMDLIRRITSVSSSADANQINYIPPVRIEHQEVFLRYYGVSTAEALSQLGSNPGNVSDTQHAVVIDARKQRLDQTITPNARRFAFHETPTAEIDQHNQTAWISTDLHRGSFEHIRCCVSTCWCIIHLWPGSLEILTVCIATSYFIAAVASMLSL